MRLRSMKIGQRLALAFSLVLLIVATSAAVGVWRLDETSDAMEGLATVGKERQELAIRWRQTIDLNWVRTEAALLEDDLAPEIRIP